MRKLILSLGSLALLFGGQASAAKYSASQRADIKLARQAILASPLVPAGAKTRVRNFTFSVMGPLRFVDGAHAAVGKQTAGEVRVMIDSASDTATVIGYTKPGGIIDPATSTK